MLTKNIRFKNFLIKSNTILIRKYLYLFLNEKISPVETLKRNYKYSYSKALIIKLKKLKNLRIIGMGGSILGAEAIYDFLYSKIKKKISFVNNIDVNQSCYKDKKKYLNIIISKSGNTLETISNANTLIKKNDKNIFITENKVSYLSDLAKKLKSEIIEHKNYIGGRYSVLSEVGMLPAELMSLDEKKFKQFNNLIKNKNFVNSLLSNVSNTLNLLNKKNYTSVILNYDEKSNNLFKWYQQLLAESLGKKSKGILPIISSMPKDNHSLMQLYLDGPKKNFYTFFHVRDKNSIKINNKSIISGYKFLKNKSINEIIYAQKIATQNVFTRSKIPFRSFEIINRNEQTLGELFCFFMLETILLGYALKVNPFDQPSVELIKKETKIILT